MLMTVLIVLLIVWLVGGLPNVSSHSYGYYPSGLALVLLIILIVLLLSGRRF